MNLASYQSIPGIQIINVDDSEKIAIDLSGLEGTPAAVLVQNNGSIPISPSMEFENCLRYTFDGNPGPISTDDKSLLINPQENVFIEGGGNIKNLVFWAPSTQSLQIIIQFFEKA